MMDDKMKIEALEQWLYGLKFDIGFLQENIVNLNKSQTLITEILATMACK